MLKPINSTPEAQDAGLRPGVSYFQVLEPAPILAANGMTQFGMVGPFLDILQANAYAATKPGALVTVTLVLLQSPPAPRAVGK